MAENKRDLRRYPRVRTGNLISLRPLRGRGKEEKITVSRVVGLGGLMFNSHRRIPAGRSLELSILAGVELIKLHVKVVGCRKDAGGGWEVGVAFQGIKDSEQIKLLDLLMRRLSLEEKIGE